MRYIYFLFTFLSMLLQSVTYASAAASRDVRRQTVAGQGVAEQTVAKQTEQSLSAQNLAEKSLPEQAAAASRRERFFKEGWLNLDQDGCVRLRGRVLNGKPSPTKSNVGRLIYKEVDAELYIRHLYIDLVCANNKVDFIEETKRPERRYVNGADLRIVLHDRSSQKMIELNLNEINKLQGSQRVYDYSEAELQGVLKDSDSILLSISDYQDNSYTRLVLRWAVQEYIEWLDSMLESPSADSSAINIKDFASLLGFEKWNFRAYRKTLHEYATMEETLNFLTENGLAYGTNYYVEVEREVGRNWNLGLRLREGDAGYFVESNFTLYFGK